MHSRPHWARSKAVGAASPCFLVALLAGLWLTISSASAQPAPTKGTPDTLQPAVAAGLDIRRDTVRNDLTASLRSIRPKVTGLLPASLWSRLGPAYEVALESLQSKPACATLFTERGVVGFELLLKVSFAPAAEGDRATCTRSVGAVTEVGGRQIRLCPSFETLSPFSAALVLIHEALHDAGMGENPPDTGSLTSGEINQLVRARCGR